MHKHRERTVQPGIAGWTAPPCAAQLVMGACK